MRNELACLWLAQVCATEALASCAAVIAALPDNQRVHAPCIPFMQSPAYAGKLMSLLKPLCYGMMQHSYSCPTLTLCVCAAALPDDCLSVFGGKTMLSDKTDHRPDINLHTQGWWL